MASLDDGEEKGEEKDLKIMCRDQVIVSMPRKYVGEFKMLVTALEADPHATEIECQRMTARGIQQMISYLDLYQHISPVLRQPLRGKLETLLPVQYHWLKQVWEMDPEDHQTFLETYRAAHFFDLHRLYMYMSAFLADLCRFHRTVEAINHALGENSALNKKEDVKRKTSSHARS